MSDVMLLDIPQEDVDNFLEDILDFLKFAPKYLRIKDEEDNIIPFVLNELQLFVLEQGDVLGKLSRGEKVRLNILKCRQTGITTLFQGIFIWLSLIYENQKMLVLGHEEKSSVNMFDMFERYFTNLPAALQPLLDTKQQGKILKYKDTKNILEVQTAGANVGSQKAGTGRSSTYSCIHATEPAFYPDFKITFKGLKQASKKAKIIVLETTANGFNDYRNSWVDSKNGFSTYIPIFLAWIKFKSYTKGFNSLDEETKLMNDLGVNIRYNSYPDEEIELIDNHDCTLEQLNWRRWAIDDLCEGEVDTFHQEYPTTDVESFLSSGRPVFDARLCTMGVSGSVSPTKIGFLDYVDEAKKEVVFRDSNKGYIKIFGDVSVEDNEFNVFAAGSDVAEGLAQGDYSVIKVMDRRTNEIALTWHGHIDPDLFGEEYHKLYLFLKKKIWINPESNNHGIAVINKAYELNVPMMYKQDFQQGAEITKDQIGTKTSGGGANVAQSKTFMINELNSYIREGLFVDREKGFWEETLTFVRDSQGRMNANGKAEGGKTYDDRVMASAMMIRCHKWMPNYNKVVVEVIPDWVKKLRKKKITKTKFSV